MTLPVKIKRSTLALVLIMMSISSVGLYFFFDYQFKISREQELKKTIQNIRILFDSELESKQKKVSFQLDQMLEITDLKKAIAQKSYKNISSIITPYYKELKASEKEVVILTFRSADGMALFRAHKPNFFGDELEKERKIIIDTNEQKKSFSGFEVGKLELSYRVTKPIFYNNVYVGSVELGITPAFIQEEFSYLLKTDIGVAVDNSFSSVMLDKHTVKVGDKHFLISRSSKLKEYFQDREKNSENYIVDMSIDLKNCGSQEISHLVVGVDTSQSLAKDKKLVNSLVIITMITMLVLSMILLRGFNKIIKFFSKQIYTDHLTGLLNRYALDGDLNSTKRKVLILNNIREFSLINELYGVDIGNKTLVEVARAFKEFAQEHDFNLFRISSDEFVLVKEESNFVESQYTFFIKNLHVKIKSLDILVEGINDIIKVELYSGVSYSDINSLEYAKMALRKGKEDFLDYLIYSNKDDTKEHSKKVIKTKQIIKDALENNRVTPFFQPIVDANEKIIKYESLVRIVDYEDGKRVVLTPFDFLDISIKSGFYAEIEKEMLKKSLDFFSNREEKISINFLPKDFFNASIMSTFIENLKKFDTPQRVIIEITEQEGVENFVKLMGIVKELRTLGVLIAIDDFGSGYANYAHILEIRPDYLKIDGSLIKNILTSEDSRILVRSIIDFAKELNIIIVAEYVENEEIFKLLKKYGVDEFQGYYFGKALDLLGELEKNE